MSDQGDRITAQDIVDVGGCGPGIRKWFSAREGTLPPGVNLRSFMRHGMTLAEARQINDGNLNRAVEKVANRGK